MTRSTLTAVMSLLLSTVASAQDLVWRKYGVADQRRVGEMVKGIGDINSDGHEDFVAIVHGLCGSPRGYYGYLWILSGFDGALLREVPSDGPVDQFEFVAPAGDHNGDGVPDYATAEDGLVSYPPPVFYFEVRVRSGVDDSVIWSAPAYGDCVLSDLDVDGDGLKDLIAGDEHALSYQGTVKVFSRANPNQPLYTLQGTPLFNIALSMAKLGDLDNDSCDDFVVGCLEPTGRGAGMIVSGRTGQTIRICYGELPGDNVSSSADATGDLDGDGVTDFILGNGALGGITRGLVQAFSGATGQRLHQWVGNWFMYATSIASRGIDLDGDGMPDVVTGTLWEPLWPSGYGTVYAYSGRDASTLHRVPTSLETSGRYGIWCSIQQAPIGEHVGRIIVPNEDYSQNGLGTCSNNIGSISIYRGTPRTSQVLGTACAGNLATPPNIGMRSLGTAGVRIHVAGAPPGVAGVLLVGLSTTSFYGVPLPAALDPLGYPGCALRTSVELMHVAMTGTVGVDAGYAYVDLPYPVPITGNGSWSLSAQWLVLGDAATFPGGLTQAVRWRR